MQTFIQLYEDKQTQQVDNWDKVVSSSGELQAALEILQTINAQGAEALIVGGAVRAVSYTHLTLPPIYSV